MSKCRNVLLNWLTNGYNKLKTLENAMKCDRLFLGILLINVLLLPLIPTDGPPAATAASAYSICTSLPDGLWDRNDFELK